MEETYKITAVVLKKEPAQESDSRLTVFSREAGKLSLLARGTAKSLSKISAHAEPLNLIDGLVVRGRSRAYLGSAISFRQHPKIKNNLEKIMKAGEGLRVFDQAVKEEEVDEKLFFLLENFLAAVEEAEDMRQADFIFAIFSLKLASFLGYKPELYYCLSCKNKIGKNGNKFDIIKGGTVCPSCAAGQSVSPVSADSIKIFRIASDFDFFDILRIKIPAPIKDEFIKIACSFRQYVFA